MTEVSNQLNFISRTLAQDQAGRRRDELASQNLRLQGVQIDNQNRLAMARNNVDLAKMQRENFNNEVVTGRDAILTHPGLSDEQKKRMLQMFPEEVQNLAFPRKLWAQGVNSAYQAHQQRAEQKAYQDKLLDLKQKEVAAKLKAAEGVIFTPQALDASSKRYAQTGQLPPMGMGKAGAQARAAVINKWAEDLNSSGSTVEEQVAKQNALKASSAELKKLQGQRGVVLAFAKTADKNLDIVEKLSGKVNRTGIPVINRWLNAGKRSVTGDKDLAAFDAALRTAINEFAKVTSSATGGGVTSDAARREVESLLNDKHTPEQIQSVINTLRQEMGNRESAYDEQIGIISEAMARSTNDMGQSKPAQGQAPQQAVEYLQQHPELKGAFKDKYGYIPEGF
jgi:hypothetical protein